MHFSRAINASLFMLWLRKSTRSSCSSSSFARAPALRQLLGEQYAGKTQSAWSLLAPASSLPSSLMRLRCTFGNRHAVYRAASLTMRSSGPCGMKFPVQSCIAARTAA
jgi:hypothetical protein